MRQKLPLNPLTLFLLPLQEEDALLSEMDVTGQAFEDMQEQNIRLMQQLREKDDANFKLMSERIKSNQIHKLLKEEKEELADQLLTLKTQVSHQATLLGTICKKWFSTCWICVMLLAVVVTFLECTSDCIHQQNTIISAGWAGCSSRLCPCVSSIFVLFPPK